jgi:hypothetical protein
MIAIVLEEDQHSRDVIGKMLARLGYTSVLFAGTLEEVGYLINEHAKGLALILASDRAAGGVDIPFSRWVIQSRELDAVPFVVMRDTWLAAPSFVMKTPRHSRVDFTLGRPFGAAKLGAAIAAAQRRRATIRNTLVVMGAECATRAASELFNFGADCHWKSVLPVRTPREFDEALSAAGFRVGGILLSTQAFPQGERDPLLERLGQFRCSPQGRPAMTPVAAYGADPLSASWLRPYCDVFFPGATEVGNPSGPEGSVWKRVLSSLSSRLIYGGEVVSLICAARKTIKSGSFKEADRAIKAGLKLDGDRWELLELAGVVSLKQHAAAVAAEFFEDALETNPCSPLSHLSLLEILSASGDAHRARLKLAREQALAYCPHHPQILKVAQKAVNP